MAVFLLHNFFHFLFINIMYTWECILYGHWPSLFLLGGEEACDPSVPHSPLHFWFYLGEEKHATLVFLTPPPFLILRGGGEACDPSVSHSPSISDFTWERRGTCSPPLKKQTSPPYKKKQANQASLSPKQVWQLKTRLPTALATSTKLDKTPDRMTHRFIKHRNLGHLLPLQSPYGSGKVVPLMKLLLPGATYKMAPKKTNIGTNSQLVKPIHARAYLACHMVAIVQALLDSLYTARQSSQPTQHLSFKPAVTRGGGRDSVAICVWVAWKRAGKPIAKETHTLHRLHQSLLSLAPKFAYYAIRSAKKWLC